MAAKNMKETINAKGIEISVLSKGDENDFISLTDIARYKNAEFPADVVKNWLRSRSTLDFLGLWEQLNNPDFKLVEFDQFKNEAGTNAFVLNPQKWITATHASGMISKSGRYGGTFAHRDIAFEFASWVSAEFKLYIITDYQRLKSDENSRISLEWKAQNTTTKGNMRDEANLHQLIVLSNLESMNAELIKQNISQSQRLITLNKMAIEQMTSILGSAAIKQLKGK